MKLQINLDDEDLCVTIDRETDCQTDIYSFTDSTIVENELVKWEESYKTFCEKFSTPMWERTFGSLLDRDLDLIRILKEFRVIVLLDMRDFIEYLDTKGSTVSEKQQILNTINKLIDPLKKELE